LLETGSTRTDCWKLAGTSTNHSKFRTLLAKKLSNRDPTVPKINLKNVALALAELDQTSKNKSTDDAHGSDQISKSKSTDNTHGSEELSREVRSKIEKFIIKHDEDSLRKIFEIHSDPEKKGLSKQNFKSTLANAGCAAHLNSWDAFNGKDLLDFEGFQRVVSIPSKASKDFERWTSSIPFNKMVAAACSPLLEWALRNDTKQESSRDINEDCLRAISKCTNEELSLVSENLAHGCLQLCKSHCRKLRDAYDHLDKRKTPAASTDSKFALNPMSCGSIAAFYEGLGGRVGIFNSKDICCNQNI
jgi:hypothetical protein